MYDSATRKRALDLLATGISLKRSQQAAGYQSIHPEGMASNPALVLKAVEQECPRCIEPVVDPHRYAYAHLLGLYLGDGHIGRLRKGVFSLRIFCDRYRDLQQEVATTMREVRPAGTVYFVPQIGCTAITGLWKHWPCLFPQHGPGMKHTRPIVLEQWQRDIVEEYPGRFLRGLLHSDGCRITNWTVRTVAGKPKRYEYPRYFFTNASTDILGLCTWALDLLRISWRQPNPRQISVARREAVATLDRHVGPKC